MRFDGVYTPMSTPCHGDHSLDYAGFDRMI
jgi:dihydrodipicolinate synthase/N-acetylneuraminate lyase